MFLTLKRAYPELCMLLQLRIDQATVSIPFIGAFPARRRSNLLAIDALGVEVSYAVQGCVNSVRSMHSFSLRIKVHMQLIV
jgi:hypothetical protein